MSNRVAGVQQTLSLREEQIANLGDKIACKDKDILSLSNSVADVQQTLSLREEQIANLSDKIAFKDKDIAALSNKVADVHQRLTNPLFEKERQIKQINDCSYAIYIQKDNEKAGKVFYSPLICIESNLYFIVYMPRKDIKFLNNHPITVFDRSASVNRVGSIKSIWGLSEKYDTKQEGQDILFLQVKFLTDHRHAKPLRLGIISKSPASYFYQFKSSSGGGDANSARILSADLFDMVNGYQNIDPGDLLISDLAISQGRATIVAIAQSNWGILKSEFRFTNKVSRQELELLKD